MIANSELIGPGKKKKGSQVKTKRISQISDQW